MLAGGWRITHRMFELVRVGQMHDLDAISIQAFIVDQPLRQHQRLRGAGRLHFDLPLQALEAVAGGVTEVLVEGDAIIVHLALPSIRRLAYSHAAVSSSRWRERNII